jgi:DNA (cytosine-5)-methyltransferase 1
VTAYYNEIDPYAAQWLRNLIDAGRVAPGDVDERSIVDVAPDDLRGYDQCHFFAGIGGWSLALRIASWDDDLEVWTGSCPCQPLSVAGQRQGHADERHLWPAFYRLIAERSPPIVFGEQVASKDGREWLAGIRADLEALGYACGASDLCCAGVGAPQIRQRIYWMAHGEGFRSWPTQPGDSATEAEIRRAHPTSSYRRFTDGFGNNYRIPEPDVPFVANGFPGILDQIRAIGNAIDPQVAAQFISAAGEAIT